MAGGLTISTLNDSSGVLATQNGMSGIAKAWVIFTVNGATVTRLNSFNISSVTKSSTGVYALSFTTALPDANYCVQGNQNLGTGAQNCNAASSLATSGFTFSTYYNGSLSDQAGAITPVCITVNR